MGAAPGVVRRLLDAARRPGRAPRRAHSHARRPRPFALFWGGIRVGGRRGCKQGPAFEKVVDTCTATARGRETLVCLETHYSPDAPTFDATWERVFRILFGVADLEALAAKTRCSKKKLLRLLVDEARAPDLQLLAVKHVSAAPKIPRDAVPAALAAARDIDRREHGGYFARLAAALGCANATSGSRLS